MKDFGGVCPTTTELLKNMGSFGMIVALPLLATWLMMTAMLAVVGGELGDKKA